MTSKELENILKSPITKGAKGRFISIEQLEQIKTIVEAWEVVKEKTFITDGGVIVFHTAIEDDNIYYETIKKALEKYNEN